MSRPGPLPTAPDHELHDPLLVAQIASGDELDPEERRKGEWFVSSCGACAALAAELRAVSGAVAWEPTPPRRRDFRIDAEQAHRLQGNRLKRFVRRLALPQSGPLRPAAAGVMSIGLVFVAAGALWPSDTIEQSSIDEVAPIRVEASFPAAPAARRPDPEAAALQGLPVESPDAFYDGAANADDLVEQQFRAESEESVLAQPEAADLGAARDSVTVDPDSERLQRVDEEPVDVTSKAVGMSQESGSSAVVSDTSAAGSQADEGADGDATASAAGDSPIDDGIDIDTLLLALGAVLAAGGGLLLALIWWSRRSADPLLR